MPIVRHVVEEGTIQADGGKQVTVRYYDQDDMEYTEGFYAAPTFDIQAKIATRQAELNEQLAIAEFEALLGDE